MSATAKPAGKRTRIKRAKRPKLAALFLLGTDGETYAACPWPEGFPPLEQADALLCVRLKRPERDLVLDAVHTDGVIEAAKLLARIARPDA